jgi:ABC-2 type transport system permease protein
VNIPRTILVSTWLHFKMLSRGTFEIITGLIVPVVQATIAVYLLRAGHHRPHEMVEATVGAGLMGVWSSVLFGSGAAIQRQRWLGTLEALIMAPRSLTLTTIPVTVATGLRGAYAMVATLCWGWLLYGIEPTFAHPWLVLVAVPACIMGLGMFGMLLASTFVLMRNANAVCNALEYPIWLLSGMLVPINVLPAWTAPIAAMLPTTWGARGVQRAVVGTGPVWPAVGWCLAISVISVGLSALSMTLVERHARATATLSLS